MRERGRIKENLNKIVPVNLKINLSLKLLTKLLIFGLKFRKHLSGAE